jgi:hypothetical protein
MKTIPVGGTKRERPHSAGEIAQFNATRDAEADSIGERLTADVGRLGLAIPWARVLKVCIPPVIQAGREVVGAVHPESPGGGKITKGELKAIGKRLGDRIVRNFEREFLDLIVDDEKA